MLLTEELWTWLDRLSLEELFTLALWIPFLIYKKVYNATSTYWDLRAGFAPLRAHQPGQDRRIRRRIRLPQEEPDV